MCEFEPKSFGGIMPNRRATPLLRVIVEITVKFPVCSKPKTHACGVFDCEFDFGSQEWSSNGAESNSLVLVHTRNPTVRKNGPRYEP